MAAERLEWNDAARRALERARRLKAAWGQHSLLKNREAVMAREAEMSMESLGITDANLHNIVPWQTEAPNQEAHLYATTLSLPKPEVVVYVQSEQPTKQKLGEKLEAFYKGVVEEELEEDYDNMRDIAWAGGWSAIRMDIKGEFFGTAPERKDDEPADEYQQRVNDHRRKERIGFPFCFTRVEPSTFYFREDKRQREVVFAVEWDEDAVETDFDPDGDPLNEGEFVVVRSRQHIWHFFLSNGVAQGEEREERDPWELLYDQENPFKHTGYFLYRGRRTGFKSLPRRYDPFAAEVLNNAQHRSLVETLVANIAVQVNAHWLETDPRVAPDTHNRQVAVERKSKGRGAQVRTGAAGLAAEFEPGAVVRWRDARELVGVLDAALVRMDQEEERYRFRDVLMGEASADQSGRAIIRLQEAAGRNLSIGFKARKKVIEEVLGVVRRVLFESPKFLGGDGNGNAIYIPKLEEGLGDEGDLRKEDVIEIKAEDNLPHTIRVNVEAMAQTAQLAWIEEGQRLEGTFSRKTIDQEFYRLQDIPQEDRRRVADQVSAALIPEAIKMGMQAAIQELQGVPIERQGVVLPQQNGAQPVGAEANAPLQGVSAQPDAIQGEDAATTMAPVQGGGFGA